MLTEKTTALTSELRWRIPTTGDPIQLRFALAQVGLATVVGALLILVAAPDGWRVPALVGLIPLAIFMAFRRWARFQRSLAGPDNVWIDAAGVHWLSVAGEEQAFARESIEGFRIGRDDDTLRPVPSLTLELSGGFESQPLELHPPATEAEIRRLLADEWGLPERSAAAGRELPYDLAIDVYSECHDEFQEWHFEGTRAALGELQDALAEAAHLPLPPPGAKPLSRVLLLRRREPTRLTLQHDQIGRLSHDAITLPADKLFELSRCFATRLNENPAPATDLKCDFPLGKGNVWTFHLHVREL
jgi:hypothetical protein